MNFAPSEKISLARHKDFDEAWVEKTIKNFPEMLGLGGLSNFQSQLIQQRVGRLDLLADNLSREQRFVIELMLGELDASHLMRVMDYWLKRKNQDIDSDLELVAVLVAEKVLVSRYFPLIQFLAQKLGSDLPLIVIEMTALKVGDQMTLSFAQVIDSSQEEIVEGEIEGRVATDHAYWVNRSSQDGMHIVDELISILKQLDPSISARYNTNYVGITKKNRANNFVWFSPKRKFVRCNVKVSDPAGWQERLAALGVEVIEASGQLLRFRLKKEQLEASLETFKELLKASYDHRFEDADD
jgi:hypothetical protein